MKIIIISLFSSVLLAACAPEVGSDRWCDMMDDKPKGEWTTNEAGEYTKSCVFGRDN